jgi:sulfate transport system ATP-binding protein
MAITVSHITKKFGEFVALDDVSVDIPDGALTALLGPSGGGKSTLLRIIAGLETPDRGTVTINGNDATQLPPQHRNVGFVFQHYAAFKHMSVRRNIAFGLEIRKRPKAEIKQRVQELLELVHLEAFGDRLPSQLSGGQRQRMALARALAVQPTVLLLDEPFGALDAQVRKELRTWLRRLHDEMHVTTVFVTHDQEEAMDVADGIVVMANAVVEQVGSPDELYERPVNDFVMSFLGPTTRLNGRLVRPHDIELVPGPAPGTAAATVARIVRLGFEVRVELEVDDAEVWVQVTRETVDRLGLHPGATVHLRASEHAIRPQVPSIPAREEATATA